MRAKESKAFGSQRAYKAHLVRGTGGLSGEIVDLREDVEEGFQNLEERAGFPELDYLDGGAPWKVGGDAVLVGRNLLQTQTFDTLKLAEGTADLDLFPVKPGDSGITVVMTVGLAGLVVTYNSTTKVLTIELAAGGSSDDAVATAINANGAQTDGHIRATSAAGGNFTAAQTSQSMTGGKGDYASNKITCVGKECLPKNATGTTSAAVWTDTKVDITVPAMSPVIQSDIAQLSLCSDGTRADVLAFAVGAGFPKLDYIDGGAPKEAGGNIVLVGRDLLQGQTFDTLKLTEAAADLDLFPVKPGDSGITVVIATPGGGLVVTYNSGTKVLNINPAAGGSSDDAIATEINNGAACTGHIRATSAAGGNFTVGQGSQPMTGGVGDYAGNVIKVAGKTCLPKKAGAATTSVAVWTDTQVDITVPSLSPAALDDIAQFTLSSDGNRAGPLAFHVGTVPPAVPELDWHDLTDGAVASGGGDIGLVGRELLQSQTFDALNILDVGVSGDITLTALKPGGSGITVVIEASGGALVIAYNTGTKVLTISPAAAGGSTDDAIATAINANGAQTDGHIRAASATAGSFDGAQASQPMVGGAGDYAGNKVMVGGLEALPINTPGAAGAAAWTDTKVEVTTQVVGAAGDHAQLVVFSNGVRTAALSAVLI